MGWWSSLATRLPCGPPGQVASVRQPAHAGRLRGEPARTPSRPTLGSSSAVTRPNASVSRTKRAKTTSSTSSAARHRPAMGTDPRYLTQMDIPSERKQWARLLIPRGAAPCAHADPGGDRRRGGRVNGRSMCRTARECSRRSRGPNSSEPSKHPPGWPLGTQQPGMTVACPDPCSRAVAPTSARHGSRPPSFTSGYQGQGAAGSRQPRPQWRWPHLDGRSRSDRRPRRPRSQHWRRPRPARRSRGCSTPPPMPLP